VLGAEGAQAEEVVEAAVEAAAAAGGLGAEVVVGVAEGPGAEVAAEERP